ncbi:hypothetical protein [Halomonas sp. MS1]|nr:hypothetical protein [Halomonas sp. MS1]UTD55964.1 hypothetical protein NF683_01715 [Halomonas sp. MS1]
MNTPFAKKPIVLQASRLCTAVTMAVGGMVVTLEDVPASVYTTAIERASSVSYAEAQQRIRSERCVDALKNYISCLDSVLVKLSKAEEAPSVFGIDNWSSQLDDIHQLEEAFDAEINKARMLRAELLPETRQARKLLGIARVKLGKAISDLRRLNGNAKSFESDIDLQGFYALADARNEQAQRFH